MTDSPFFHILEQVGFTIDFEERIFLAPSGRRLRGMMRSYQRYLSDCIVDMEGLLGAAEMSLGKTGASLDGVQRILHKRPAWRVLIVGPLEVVKNTWPDEIEQWEHLHELTYSLIRVDDDDERVLAAGREKLRAIREAQSPFDRLMERLGFTSVNSAVSAAQIAEKYRLQMENVRADVDIHLINRENLQWLWEAIGGSIGWRWDVLIYDESSRLKGFSRRTPSIKYKNGKKVRVKPQLTEFGVLAQARKHMSKVVELSGTPSPNGLIDLGGQAFLIDQGKRLGHNKTNFQTRFFDVNPFSREIKPKPTAEAEIMGSMKDIMIGLRAQDYIDLPPRHFNPIKVKLPAKLMKEYRAFERTMVAEQYDVEALSRGVMVNKLLQFSNGGLYKSDPDVFPAVRETIAIHDYKLKALENIIAEAAGNSVLVGYSFQFDRDRIRKRFPKAVFFEDDKNFVKNWNAGKIGMGVAHPASIGHGLNLQFGGFIQVWYGLTWSLELWDQFNRRLARPGQKNPTVFIHVILAEGTEDERQFAILQTKGVTQDRIIDTVRVRLSHRN